jgi:hypothetical protein
MTPEKNHKDIFVYGDRAITLENITEVGTMDDDSYSFVVYGHRREVKLSNEMAAALLVELSLVTVTDLK